MEEFLINEFGKENGQKIYEEQQLKFSELVSKIKGKSNTQIQTLKTSILPRIALYKVLQGMSMDNVQALKIVKKCFLEDLNKVASKFKEMEKDECFYRNFCTMFSEMLKGDNWESEIIKSDNESMVFNMKKCIWNDTCIENGCPEMAEMFCWGDNIAYGCFNKITFKRTQTLGQGGNCCDFKFINNSANKDIY